MLFMGLFVLNSCEENKDIPVYTMPVYPALYMVGSATPAGWNIDNPTPMIVDEENAFQFTWEGQLNPGEFKIPVSKGNWGTDYFMPTVNGESDLINATCMLVKGGNPDNKWVVNKTAVYRITINIEDLDNPTIMFEVTQELPDYPDLYLVGDASPAGWNIDAPTPMVVSEGNPYLFTWEGQLNVGALKIPTTTGNWGCDYFMPSVDGESDLANATCQLVKGGNPDYKWQISEAGTYRITIDIEDLEAPTILFEKL